MRTTPRPWPDKAAEFDVDDDDDDDDDFEVAVVVAVVEVGTSSSSLSLPAPKISSSSWTVVGSDMMTMMTRILLWLAIDLRSPRMLLLSTRIWSFFTLVFFALPFDHPSFIFDALRHF
jgi:hypothetical protein